MNSNQGYTEEQLRQIELGRKHHINVTPLMNSKLSADQMGILRVAMERGVDVSEIARPELSEDKMYILINFLTDQFPLEPRFIKEFSADLLQFIYYCYRRELNYENFPYNNFSAGQLRELSKGLVQGVDITKFARPEISETMMNRYRLSLAQNG